MMLAFAFFACFAVYGVSSPYLSVLLHGLGYGPGMIGILLGIFEIAGIAGPFLLGRIADGSGRYRPMFVVSCALMILPLWPLSAFGNVVASVIALCALAIGLRSFVPLLDAYATLHIGPGGNYGRLRAVGSLSFVFMTLFLQFVPVLKPETPGAIAFWLGVTASILFVCVLVMKDAPHPFLGVVRDSMSFPARKVPKSAETVKPVPENSVARTGSILVIGLIIIGLGRLAMAPIQSFFSLFVVDELQWDAVGAMWALAAASEIPVMLVSAMLIRKYGPSRLLAVSIMAIVVRLAIYAIIPTRSGAVLGQLLHSICYGLFHPAAVAFIAMRAAPEKRAMGMTLYLSLGVGLPSFAGSALGGWMVERFGYRILFASFIAFAATALVVYFTNRSRLEDDHAARTADSRS